MPSPGPLGWPRTVKVTNDDVTHLAMIDSSCTVGSSHSWNPLCARDSPSAELVLNDFEIASVLSIDSAIDSTSLMGSEIVSTFSIDSETSSHPCFALGDGDSVLLLLALVTPPPRPLGHTRWVSWQCPWVLASEVTGFHLIPTSSSTPELSLLPALLLARAS